MDEQVKEKEDTEVYLHREEAIKFVKKSYKPGITHYVRGGTWLYKDGTENKTYWDWSCWISVSQKSALHYIKQIMPDVLVNEASIKISVHPSEYAPCIFIG